MCLPHQDGNRHELKTALSFDVHVSGSVSARLVRSLPSFRVFRVFRGSQNTKRGRAILTFPGY